MLASTHTGTRHRTASVDRPIRRPAAGVARPAELPGPRATVTMRDVARMTGVSQSTVSRVLSGAPTAVPIADDTRERVVAAARTLGYRPNPLARGLRGMPTMLLG